MSLESGTATALVSYENDSKLTFRNITVGCAGFDKAHNKVDYHHRSFFGRDVGDIAPGFTGTLKIPVGSAEVVSAKCYIVVAN